MTFSSPDVHVSEVARPFRVHVIIATCGRAETASKLVRLLQTQTRPADGLVVVGTCDADVAGVMEADPAAKVVIGQRGLCCQRNLGLEAVRGIADAVIFFDDDFVPAIDYVEAVERLMSADPTIAGLTGVLVDDGINHDPVPFDDAVQRLYVNGELPDAAEAKPRTSLYGCNMAIRLASLGELRFDEALPLYGWMEDVDLTFQLGQRGRLVEAAELTGIHLGSRSSRQSGRRLGYSQVANIVYMHRKGTLPPDTGWCKMRHNIAANLLKSFRPEPHVDRRGRLQGNLMALGDLLRGQINPGRIVSL